ncbi:SH3 domain-containing protein [Streptomyces sp. NPDC001634]|uniref:SH3 domain-containing protein n=1 Tax=Streptomyces sp. NPDC001634 TaxID=3154390 RepID=UPI003318BAC6
MIRRTLQSGLLAAVALFALVPTAAVAVAGDQAASAPVVATVAHRPHTLLPVPARHMPVRHCARRATRCHHHARHAGRAHYMSRTSYHRRSTRVVGRVTTRYISLNVRSGPGFGYRVIGHRQVHGRLLVVCKKHGSYVFGNRRWYRLAGGQGYVSAHYVRTRGVVPWC